MRRQTPAPIATEALVRIAALYAIEADIRGLAADERRQTRQRRTKPLVDDLRLWTVIASRVETCKMNAVDPQAYLHDVLSKIVARHPMGRIDELLPFAYVPAAEKAAA